MTEPHRRLVALVAFSALITALILTGSRAEPGLKIQFLASITAVVCGYGVFQMLIDRATHALLGLTSRR